MKKRASTQIENAVQAKELGNERWSVPEWLIEVFRIYRETISTLSPEKDFEKLAEDLEFRRRCRAAAKRALESTRVAAESSNGVKNGTTILRYVDPPELIEVLKWYVPPAEGSSPFGGHQQSSDCT